jgi:hypothetical protein
LYGGSRWSLWRPPLLSEPGVSFVPQSISFLGLLFLTPRHQSTLGPGRGGSHSGLFVRGCRVLVLYEQDSFTSLRGLSGGSVTLHPVALISYPWAQRGRFALQGIEYAFLYSSVRISTSIEANPTAVTGPVLISWVGAWGSRSGGVLPHSSQQNWRHKLSQTSSQLGRTRATKKTHLFPVGEPPSAPREAQ